MTSGIKNERLSNSLGSGFSAYSSLPNAFSSPVKHESSSSKPAALPDSYPDDSSIASDSDIEIIDSSIFHANGRLKQQTSMSTPHNASFSSQVKHQWSPEAQEAGAAALRRVNAMQVAASTNAMQYAVYGNQLNQVVPTQMAGSVSDGFGYPNATLNNHAAFQPSSLMYHGPMQHGGGYTVNNLPSYGMNGTYPTIAGPSQGFHAASSMFSDAFSGIMHGRINNISDDEMPDFQNPTPEKMHHLDYMLADPKATEQQIKDLLENIKPDNDLPVDDRENTPEGLKGALVSHSHLNNNFSR